MKKDYYIAGLLGIAAVAVLYFLYREMQAAPAAEDIPAAPPDPSLNQGYPQNPAPIQLGNITINDTPQNQNANVPYNGPHFDPVSVQPDSDGNGGCCDDDCDAAGQPVTVQKIPQSVIDQGTAALDSFLAKPKGPVSFQETLSQSVTNEAGLPTGSEENLAA